jgi:hypothetical protein
MSSTGVMPMGDAAMPSAPADGSRRRHRIARWRRAQGFAAFVLFTTFFMPIVDGCNSPIYPFMFATELCWDAVAHAPHIDFDEFFIFFPRRPRPTRSA